MISLNENSSVDKNKTVNILSKHTRGYYVMDRELIISDRDNYLDMSEKEKDKKIKKHYEDIVKYLNTIIKNIDSNNKVKVYWTLLNGKLVTAPLMLQNSRWLGLDTTDYIAKKDDRTVVVSYKDLWNAVAIQLAHRELDLDTKEIDIRLSNVGCRMLGVESVEKLFECANIKNAYNQAIELKIYDTPYCNKVDVEVYRDYFGQPISSNTYKEMIDKSIDRMMSIIITETLGELPGEMEENVEFIGVFEDRIYYNTSLSTVEIEKYIASEIAIRLFGRTFEIKPEIEIF